MVRPKKLRGKLPPFVFSVKARGKEYFYYQPHRGTIRREGRVSIPGEPYDKEGMPNGEWWATYRRLAGEDAPVVKGGTFEALILAYQASPEWLALSQQSKANYGRYLREIGKRWGGLKVSGVEPRHVLALRDYKAATPAAANYIVRVLSTLLAWSVPRGYRSDNPCMHVKMLKGGEGYAHWTWEQISYLREHARPDLWHAAALALYSGQRQADCLHMLWSDIEDGAIAVVQQKTGKKLRIPMHRDLKAILQDIPKRSLTVLSNTRMRPWTVDGFKTSWGKELDRPEMGSLKGLVFHGLRKSAVVFLLEAGCTDAEVAAISGQSRQMVEHYARQVNQGKLAAQAVLKWEAAAN